MFGMEHHHLRHQAIVPRRAADPVNQRGIGARVIVTLPSMGGPLSGVFSMMAWSRTASSGLFRVMYADAIRSQIQRAPR
jgi:hypothetical protein